MIVVGGDVDVGVVSQQVATRIDPVSAITRTAGLHRLGAVVIGDGVVVDRLKHDLQAVLIQQRIFAALTG